MNKSQQPLVPGGILEFRRETTSTTMWNSETSHRNDKGPVIMGVCSTGSHSSEEQPAYEHHWFTADFYAFKHMLGDISDSHQYWLTDENPYDVLNQQPGRKVLMHGDPYRVRKVILSEHMLDTGQITMPEVESRDEIARKFSNKLIENSNLAANRNQPLLLFLSCHGVNPDIMDQGIVLGTGEGSFIEISKLIARLNPSCRLAIVTNACFSGGWVIPSSTCPLPVKTNLLAAASAGGVSYSWAQSPSIGRYCGSMCMSALISTLGATNSPMLAEPDPKPIDYNNPLTSPSFKNAVQVQSWNAFCRSVIHHADTVLTQSPPADTTHHVSLHTFTFGARDDDFDQAWAACTGLGSVNFGERLDALEDIKPDLHQLGSVANGQTAEARLHAMNVFRSAMADANVLEMAKAWLYFCPYDECTDEGRSLDRTLRDLIKGEDVGGDSLDPHAAMIFRWEMAGLADDLVCCFNLPLPGGQPCIIWDRAIWTKSMRTEIGADVLERRQTAVWRHLLSRRIQPLPAKSQGEIFGRFKYYLTASIIEARLDETEENRVIADMTAIVNGLRSTKRVQALTQRVQQHAEVRRTARQWFTSLGRKVVRSVSPRKRST